tara:strand:- start:782 stop:2638 length:1857 start_codon:yes stop_codon:yes gene_type:complete
MSNAGKIWNIREAYKKQRGNQWIEPGNIGLYGGDNSILNTVDQINISNNGNATDFGDLTESIKKGAAAGALTRTVRCGGSTPSDVNTMDFANPFNAGNFVNFGDLTAAGQTTNTAHSNNVRGISSEGQGSPGTKNLNVFTIASQGNAAQFGDVTQNDAIWSCGGGNNTRYFSAGAYPASNIICVKSIANDADCVDFGDLSASKWGVSQNSNPTRICFSGGQEPGKSTDIEFITIATAGNSTDFGDLTRAIGDTSAACNSIRGVVQGSDSPSTAGLDVFTLATTGNATDFGDTTRAFDQCFGASNGHGGIPQTDQFPQRASVNYMPGSGRAIICGGPPSPKIETFNISTLGNTVTFGSLILNAENWGGGCGNATRMLEADGGADSGYTTQISAIEMASFGNASDFGDSTSARANQGSLANSTRGVWGGGYDPDGSPAYSNVIDYVTISTFGNATDFGDLTTNGSGAGGTANSTRGIFGPRGPGSGTANVIDYITIGSTGNTTDFGDATVSRGQTGMGASSTRALLGGGGGTSNVIDYVTIASTGNATDFGDLTVGRQAVFCTTNNSRIVWGGGYTPSQSNVIDYATIASTGNAVDFGDIASGARANVMASSDSHGGLQS